MFRCLTNEGETTERLFAADTREDLDEMIREYERDGLVRTKRFFSVKPSARNDNATTP